jgi:hypothetical protein
MEEAKQIFIITTLVGLIVVAVILPKFIAYINRMEPHFAISGFQDMHPASVEESTRVPQIPSEDKKEPSSLVRKALCGDEPCPEGTFCDDLTQTCVSLYPSSSTPDEGYYA